MVQAAAFASHRNSVSPLYAADGVALQHCSEALVRLARHRVRDQVRCTRAPLRPRTAAVRRRRCWRRSSRRCRRSSTRHCRPGRHRSRAAGRRAACTARAERASLERLRRCLDSRPSNWLAPPSTPLSWSKIALHRRPPAVQAERHHAGRAACRPQPHVVRAHECRDQHVDSGCDGFTPKTRKSGRRATGGTRADGVRLVEHAAEVDPHVVHAQRVQGQDAVAAADQLPACPPPPESRESAATRRPGRTPRSPPLRPQTRFALSTSTCGRRRSASTNGGRGSSGQRTRELAAVPDGDRRSPRVDEIAVGVEPKLHRLRAVIDSL